MTTKPKVRKFRLRRASPLSLAPAQAGPPPDPTAAPGAAAPDAAAHAATAPAAAAAAPPPDLDGPRVVSAAEAIDAIRAEGLTGRQLRVARRVAQKHGLAVTSDFDAVRQLREMGIDPFQRSNVLELIVPGATAAPDKGAAPGDAAADAAAATDDAMMEMAPLPRASRVQLPQTIPEGTPGLPSTERAPPRPGHGDRLAEIQQIQRDLVRRRRRNMIMLMARLAVMVVLPTLLAGIYYTRIATPMFATHSEFQIKNAEPAGAAAGLGSMLSGTSMATQQDSVTVQGYLTSRAAMAQLDADHGFKAHFSDPGIDPIQRLPADASNEQTYRLYEKNVKIGYDPTEGIIRMEVIAASPEASQEFSEALIRYAEEQVDQLTLRLREDAMTGAQQAYEQAEARRQEALATWLGVQEQVQQIDPIGETAARTGQISALETQRQRLTLELQTRLAARRPNEAQVDALQQQITGIENLIADLRAQMTADGPGGSLATRNTELRAAEENYTFQTLMVQAAQQSMEASRLEAERQQRYLSLSVPPVAPDEATYPRAFENTLLAFLLFGGIYLMISLTASVLREQVAT